MTTSVLTPQLNLLTQEYFLIQAWKKTANYIRYHNWFSDTLELDKTTINIQEFLAKIGELLRHPEQWENETLRIVPAPKSQQWSVSNTTGLWEPRKKSTTASRLRPLAYVSLRDQVVATGLMLCLANRVETMQGDSRSSIRDPDARMRVISYGNRLFCDTVNGELHHRWGSAKLYRAYYQDYRAFLMRSEVIVKSTPMPPGQRYVIVHSDLLQFYDRVRPALLEGKLKKLQLDGDDPAFFDFAKRLLAWHWHSRDVREVGIYAQQAGLGDFSNVALPQGLVSAGFFANVVLIDFDKKLRGSINYEIAPGVRVRDACRYVDDLRIVLSISNKLDLRQVEEIVYQWLKDLLDKEASGLEPSLEKTKAAEIGGGDRPLVRQSSKMNRIQCAVSTGFDAIGGEEILDAIQGLIRSQQSLRKHSEESGWRFSSLSDVRDETVARFAAARFRSTFRSLRPLLEKDYSSESMDLNGIRKSQGSRSNLVRKQSDLDDEARVFALSLIERWVEDPSNVRLLRIGLDLWPDAEILKYILKLLKPFTEKGGRRKAPRRVAWYCLSEILRAGATETGFVEEEECLPEELNIANYRTVLQDEAARLAKLPAETIPWYLRQQALLFLAAHNPFAAPVVRTGYSIENKHYREVIRYLRGEGDQLRSSDFAMLAVLARRAFCNRQRAIELAQSSLTPMRLNEIGRRDPTFLLELLEADRSLQIEISARLRDDLCLGGDSEKGESKSLVELVLKDGPLGVLRNELALLRFAVAFLNELQDTPLEIDVITPLQVRVKLQKKATIAEIENIKIVASRVNSTGSIYLPPYWCSQTEHWRFQLGFLLRFILAVHQDFTRIVRQPYWKEDVRAYRVAESHWIQRIYGLYNGQMAFGNDWLPISDWMERFLSTLLCWPGCHVSDDIEWDRTGVKETLPYIKKRILLLEKKQGASTGVLILPMVVPSHTSGVNRPLRACVVQTAVPDAIDFKNTDLELNQPSFRRRHRNHLSAALAAVERMLTLRETHKGNEGRLDWLILPELAVHPRDVRTHLMPFARAHRAIILAGLTYEEVLHGQPLVNSAIWIIPEWTETHGLQLRIRRQGKLHLAPDEISMGANRLQGFRPCQWLIGYPWSNNPEHRPLWLTASVCYDATDLGLAADLRNESDIFAIPALNRDVKTFDQMALALHYHMFQLVVVANNGQFGGSNAYWPSSDVLKRQVFHLHGQPQASIAFLEIENIAEFLERRNNPGIEISPWKYPPAGLSG